MADDYLCPRCGVPLKNAPHHQGVDHAGRPVTVMACADCGRFFARTEGGQIIEVEAFDVEE